jgi:hypothetical protein
MLIHMGRHSQVPGMREMIQSKLINNSGTLEWIDRESEVASLSSNEVQMVPILTRLVGDEVAIRKNCLCFCAAVSELHTRHTRNKQRRHPPPPPRTPQPTKHNKVAIVARYKSSNRSHNHPSFIPTFVQRMWWMLQR